MFFEKSQLENGVSFKGYTVDTDGCYYTLYSDENENVNMYTIDTLCRILQCGIDEIAEHIPDE